MRNAWVYGIAFALAASTLPVMAKGASSAQACWQHAFEAGDADAVAACYAPDAVLWLPGAPMMKGRAAIRAGYAGYFSAFTIKSAKLVPLGHAAHGGDLSTWGTFTLVLAAKSDGKQRTETGRYTDLSRRSGGRWLYVVDHASDDPAAPGG
ncbi:YybH family protein [Cognatilysobacter lacus]|nr:nuclear transport factor 2 family protein [Lysobacter lacus]